MASEAATLSPYLRQESVEDFRGWFLRRRDDAVTLTAGLAGFHAYVAERIASATGGTAVLEADTDQTIVIPERVHPQERWFVDTYLGNQTLAEEGELDFATRLNAFQRITELSDAEIAELFPHAVSRETVNRWRRQPSNPRSANIHRVGVLYDLARRIDQLQVPPGWLREPFADSEITPVALLQAGRLADVRQALEGRRPDAPTPVPLSYRGHDELPQEEDEPEPNWNWDES